MEFLLRLLQFAPPLAQTYLFLKFWREPLRILGHWINATGPSPPLTSEAASQRKDAAILKKISAEDSDCCCELEALEEIHQVRPGLPG
jgi:hypothetical protein